MQSNYDFISSLPNDRLLHMFRVTAGISSTAAPLGGWEEPKSELRGHFAGGHILSACALHYAASGDDKIKQKGDALVAELAKCQNALGPEGYLSAYPTEFYDRLRERKARVWAPFYTYHKILAGHLDMYTLCGNQQALAIAENMAGWVGKYLKPISDEQWAKMQMVEHGGMNESLFNLYAITGKEQYLGLARRFDHKKFFDPLAEQRDELNKLHANTNIPKVIGAARGYELTGDQTIQGVSPTTSGSQVTTQHTYCTGGTSNGEGWQPAREISRPVRPGCRRVLLQLQHDEAHAAHFWLDRRTRRPWTTTSASFSITALGTQDRDGMKMYYVSLTPGLWKTFGTRFDAFWCCTGTGGKSSRSWQTRFTFTMPMGIYVNLFIASELNWQEQKFAFDTRD